MMGDKIGHAKTIQVDKLGIFKCPCEDDGAVPGVVQIRLGKYTFWPCMRCFRQIEGMVMQAVLTTGAKMAVEANLARQAAAEDANKLAEIKKEL